MYKYIYLSDTRRKIQGRNDIYIFREKTQGLASLGIKKMYRLFASLIGSEIRAQKNRTHDPVFFWRVLLNQTSSNSRLVAFIFPFGPRHSR